MRTFEEMYSADLNFKDTPHEYIHGCCSDHNDKLIGVTIKQYIQGSYGIDTREYVYIHIDKNNIGMLSKVIFSGVDEIPDILKSYDETSNIDNTSPSL